MHFYIQVFYFLFFGVVWADLSSKILSVELFLFDKVFCRLIIALPGKMLRLSM